MIGRTNTTVRSSAPVPPAPITKLPIPNLQIFNKILYIEDESGRAEQFGIYIGSDFAEYITKTTVDLRKYGITVPTTVSVVSIATGYEQSDIASILYNPTETQKLPLPVVSINQFTNTLTVSGIKEIAETFKVFVDNETTPRIELYKGENIMAVSYDLTKLGLTPGLHTIVLQAFSTNWTQSDKTTSVNYTASNYEMEGLSISLSGKYVYITAPHDTITGEVPSGLKYTIYKKDSLTSAPVYLVENIPYAGPGSSQQYNLDSIEALQNPGSCYIGVIANASGYNSSMAERNEQYTRYRVDYSYNGVTMSSVSDYIVSGETKEIATFNKLSGYSIMGVSTSKGTVSYAAVSGSSTAYRVTLQMTSNYGDAVISIVGKAGQLYAPTGVGVTGDTLSFTASSNGEWYGIFVDGGNTPSKYINADGDEGRPVTYELRNCGVTSQNSGFIETSGSLTVIFSALSGYALPDNVTAIGATVISWTKATGTLVLSYPTGNVTVTVNATKA